MQTSDVPINKHDYFGGSVIQRRHNCPASYSQEKAIKDDFQNEASLLGTCIHNAIALCVQNCFNGECTEPEEIRPVVTNAISALSLYKETLKCYFIKAEVPITSFNGHTGTADIVALNNKENPTDGFLIDWKTGYGTVPEAKQNLQGAFYALGLYKQHETLQTLTVIIYNPVNNTHSEAKTRRSDFENIEKLFIQIEESCKSKNPAFKTGEHCKYCKAKLAGTCPALKNDVEKLSNQVPQPSDTLQSIPPVFKWSNAELVEFVKKAKIVGDFEAKAEEEIKRRCRENGGSIEGAQLKKRKGRKTVEDVSECAKQLASECGMDVFKDILPVCSMSITKLNNKVKANNPSDEDKEKINQVISRYSKQGNDIESLELN